MFALCHGQPEQQGGREAEPSAEKLWQIIALPLSDFNDKQLVVSVGEVTRLQRSKVALCLVNSNCMLLLD